MEVLECSVSIYNFSKVLMYLAPDYRLPSPIPSMNSIIFNPNGNAAGKCNTILFTTQQLLACLYVHLCA